MQDRLQQRLDFTGLCRAEHRLTPIADSAVRHLDTALQHFAAQAVATPSAARFLFGRERIEGDGGGPAAHWRALVAGRLDQAFAEAAKRMGQRQARIGADPHWQSDSHAIIAQDLVRGIVRDGIAAALAPRRGPLGLLGADPMAARDGADRLAEGLAALIGAIVLDLDLTFAGYAEKLKQDADARLAAQEAKWRQALAQAAIMLEEAAEGRRGEALSGAIEPELAPLYASAEKLADRASGLVADLATAGKAVEDLAAQVLAAGKVLARQRGVEAEGMGRLAEMMAAQLPMAVAQCEGVGSLARHAGTLARRCSKGLRDIAALRQAVDAPVALDEAMRLLERLGSDMATDGTLLRGLARQGQQLAAGLKEVETLVDAMRGDSMRVVGESGKAEQALRAALDGVAALVGLAGTLGGTDAPEAQEEGGAVYPAPDQVALAAHWHAV